MSSVFNILLVLSLFACSTLALWSFGPGTVYLLIIVWLIMLACLL